MPHSCIRHYNSLYLFSTTDLFLQEGTGEGGILLAIRAIVTAHLSGASESASYCLPLSHQLSLSTCPINLTGALLNVFQAPCLPYVG